MQRNEIQFLYQITQLVLPWHIVFAERHRLAHLTPDTAHVFDHAVHRNEVIGPVHRGFVADGHRKDDVGMGVSQCDEPADLGLVLRNVGFELLFGERGSPRAAEVVHFCAKIGTQHDPEIETVAPYHLKDALCMRTAVVQTQQWPVRFEHDQVFADLVERGVNPAVRTLAVAVSRITDGAAAR